MIKNNPKTIKKEGRGRLAYELPLVMPSGACGVYTPSFKIYQDPDMLKRRNLHKSSHLTNNGGPISLVM